VDRYELRGGTYKFGYYDCDRIVQGGAADDYQYHYFCSSGYDLYQGARQKAGSVCSQGLENHFTRGGSVTPHLRSIAHCLLFVNLRFAAGCVASCGAAMADYTSFNFTSALFGEVADTSTSQIFS